jgi:uncharacterized membrane protein
MQPKTGLVAGLGFFGGLTIGTGLGAGLMYTFDPDTGRRRRSVGRDKLRSLMRRERRLLEKGARDLEHRVTGAVERLSSAPHGGEATDHVIEERVRAALGRAVSHPHAIEVRAHDGRVVLTGLVIERELRELVRRVSRVAGVRAIENRLETHESGEGIPALQGGRRVPRRRLERDVWPPAWRLTAGAAGLGVGLYGLGRGGLSGTLLAAGGAALFVRASTNRPLARLVGRAGAGRMIDFRKSLVIHAPVQEVYRFWTHVENFPRFMEHIVEVTMSGEIGDSARSHWKVRGPGGIPMNWDAEVTRREENQVFSWKTLPGSTVEHAGSVHFESLGPDTTRVHVQMTYNPPAGAVGHAVATLLGSDPKSRMDEDLVRMKSLLEEGRTRAHGERITREQVERTERPLGRP